MTRGRLHGTLGVLIGFGILAVLIGGPATFGQSVAVERTVVLLASSPGEFAELTHSPSEVVLHFDSAVGLAPPSIRVFADTGASVGAGAAFHPAAAPAEIAERLPPLRPGVYLVAWQATGGRRAAGGPGPQASGGYWFTVLAGPNAHPPISSGNVRALLAELDAGKPNTTVTVLTWLVRLLAATATLVLIGVGAAIGLLWPEGWSRRWSIVVAWSACGTLLLSTVAAVGLQRLYAARLSVSHLFSWSLFAASLRTHDGHAELAIWAVVVAGGVELQLLDQGLRRGERVPPRWWNLISAATAIALLIATALAGPGDAGRWRVVGVTCDVVHLGAASVWVGALLVLVSCLGSAFPSPEAERIARRASRLALTGVAALAISGAVEAVRQSGGADGLTGTTYGRLLVVKSITAAAAISLTVVIAGRLRGRQHRRSDQTAVARRRILRAALIEMLLLAGTLGVTASLVGTEPAQQVLSQPYGHVFTLDGTDVTVIVDPAQVGADNILHIYTLRPDGAPVDLLEINGVLRLPSAGIGPLTVPLVNAGLAHFIATGIDLPLAGNWQLSLTVHTGLASSVPIVTTVPIH